MKFALLGVTEYINSFLDFSEPVFQWLIIACVVKHQGITILYKIYLDTWPIKAWNI